MTNFQTNTHKEVKEEEKLINELKMMRKKYPEPVFIDAIKYLVAEETIKQIEKRTPGVFIERAALCTVEEIRAICGTDEEYSEYIKSLTPKKEMPKEEE